MDEEEMVHSLHSSMTHQKVGGESKIPLRKIMNGTGITRWGDGVCMCVGGGN